MVVRPGSTRWSSRRSRRPGSGGPSCNPRADEGQLSSLIAGLDAIDRPGVGRRARDAGRRAAHRRRRHPARCWRAPPHPPRRFSAPSTAGRHGHPVIFKRRLFDALRRADPARRREGRRPRRRRSKTWKSTIRASSKMSTHRRTTRGSFGQAAPARAVNRRASQPVVETSRLMPMREIRLTVRSLARTPLYTLTAILSLALGHRRDDRHFLDDGPRAAAHAAGEGSRSSWRSSITPGRCRAARRRASRAGPRSAIRCSARCRRSRRRSRASRDRTRVAASVAYNNTAVDGRGAARLRQLLSGARRRRGDGPRVRRERRSRARRPPARRAVARVLDVAVRRRSRAC